METNINFLYRLNFKQLNQAKSLNGDLLLSQTLLLPFCDKNYSLLV